VVEWVSMPVLFIKAVNRLKNQFDVPSQYFAINFAYLNETRNVETDLQHWRLKLMGLVECGENGTLIGTGPGMVRQKLPSRDFIISTIKLTCVGGTNLLSWQVTQTRCTHKFEPLSWP
jgi:hypothetical protein